MGRAGCGAVAFCETEDKAAQGHARERGVSLYNSVGRYRNFAIA